MSDSIPSLEAAARELGELARTAPDGIRARLEDVPPERQAEIALHLAAAERLELLLHAPKPMALVRALPDSELYLTVREVGPTDALPLLALASADQIEHLVDLESWRGERFDPKRSGAWAAVLMEAGESTLRRFLRRADDDLLALLAQQWLRVCQIEIDDTPSIHGPGESETGDERGFVSPDGYHRIAPVIAEHGPAAQRFLQMLFVEQPERYQRLLWTALQTLPSELEEHARHWRQSRLDEHGFPSWDEAIEVYGAPAGSRRSPGTVLDGHTGGPAASRLPVRLLPHEGRVRAALQRLPGPERERVLAELVALANRVLVADGADTGNPDRHREALVKSAGYVELGLERRRTGAEKDTDATLSEVPVLELFREGYQPVALLKGRAERMTGTGWGAVHPSARELLDAPIRQRVAGLLAPRPQYFDLTLGDQEETALRDFRTTAEIEETEVAVELSEILGAVFIERLGLDVAALVSVPDHPRFSTLLSTTLAWHAARDELRCEPLPADVSAEFLRNVVSRRTAPPEAPARSLETLLGDLSRTAGLAPRQRHLLAGFGRACLERLAAECGNADPGAPLDPRFVRCLLLAG